MGSKMNALHMHVKPASRSWYGFRTRLLEKTQLDRKIPALFFLRFACCTEIALHNEKILTRFNSLKSKDPWFVKHGPNYFPNTDCEHRLEKHPSISTRGNLC